MENLQLISPPRTIMEVFKMLPEGTLAELINETLYMSPAPTSNHQRISRKLTIAISTFVENKNLGEVFYAPLDIYFDEHANVVQPDIIFIPTHKSESIEISGMHGVPDLIIEILSPGNSKHDKVIKKDLYEKFGVKEYWIVNPDTKESIGYELKEGAYKEIENSIGKINSVLLSHSFEF
jgi:Uma2 family endonuclease